MTLDDPQHLLNEILAQGIPGWGKVLKSSNSLSNLGLWCQCNTLAS